MTGRNKFLIFFFILKKDLHLCVTFTYVSSLILFLTVKGFSMNLMSLAFYLITHKVYLPNDETINGIETMTET